MCVDEFRNFCLTSSFVDSIANRRGFSFSRLNTKRLGLVDDFRTFRLERPGPELLAFLAA
jgi:hypothetical protein